MRKTLLILANSFKHGQQCVAGKEVASGRWIRPVADDAGKELSGEQTRCGSPFGDCRANVLQVVEIPFDRAAPLVNQPENHVIGPEPWVLKRRVDRLALSPFLDDPDLLWCIRESGPNGVRDRVSHARILSGEAAVPQSLYLIRPEKAKGVVKIHPDGKRRVRVRFVHRGLVYDLPATDPHAWRVFLSRGEGEYLLDEGTLLTISLAAKFTDGYCYKVVASVL